MAKKLVLKTLKKFENILRFDVLRGHFKVKNGV